MTSSNGQTAELTVEYRDPPVAGTEAEHVVGSLERQRALLAWKCGGLDAAGLQATLGPSTITLGGLLKHLALVEDTHFQRLLLGNEEITGEPWAGVDWDADPNWEWHSAPADSPAELMALWQAAVERSRELVAAALREGDLDQLGAYVNRDGQQPSLRRIMLDMIEEYARHVGHADLIRESVDGLVGEDPKG
jgi:Protein of unknown function (DUF664)